MPFGFNRVTIVCLFALTLLLRGTFALAEEPAGSVAVGVVPDLTKTIDFERPGQYHLGPTGARAGSTWPPTS